jgi:hypothetical protein
MKQRGLITLADLPELAGNDRSATIAIARLDKNLRDPRYGKFAIKQSDVDGWRRNLDEVFGGRVAIDFDHSSDRGRGTKAAAWITGIGQEGKLVTANVEFTPSGAKAVRDGDYKMISPTFVQNYVDEHGISHGRALLGAALTNRPVLRKDMPVLSLSRAAEKRLAKATKKLGKKARKKALARQEAKLLDISAADRLAAQKAGNSLPDGSYPIPNVAKLKAAAVLAASKHGDWQAAQRLIRRRAKELGVDVNTLPGFGKTEAAAKKARKAKKSKQLDRKASKKLRRTIRALAQPGLDPARPWGDPTAVQATGGGRVPPGLDRDGLLLHGQVARKAAQEGVPYFEALSRLSGNDSYRQLSDIPPAQTDEGGLMTSVAPERAELYGQARLLARAAGIGWQDAVEILEQGRELAELQADDGSAPADWLDSSERPTPPRPWSDDDWQRDQRRAAAAGVQVDKAAWEAGAELGVDAVGQLADAQRADRIATLKARSAGALGEAQQREDERRRSAVNDELTARARKRTLDAERARVAPAWHPSYGNGR